MKHINIFKRTSDFETAKEQLNELEHYTIYNAEDEKVYLKTISKESYFTIIPSGVKIGNYPPIFNNFFIYEKNKDISNETLIAHEIEAKDDTLIKCEGFPYGFSFVDIFDENFYETSLGGVNFATFDVSNYDTSNIKSAKGMFGYIGNLREINGINLLNTKNIEDMSGMFVECNNLISLDLSNWDTSNVTNMNNMFKGCYLLTSLDLSNFNTSKVISMGSMFLSCSGLKSLDLSNFDTSMVTNMYHMFNSCNKLTSLDLSSFDTSKVTNWSSMFSGCDSLIYIKCKQAFKDKCMENQDTIDLPTAMREGGKGQWDIV